MAQEGEMIQGTVKNSNDSSAPSEPRSLRSKKRECPSDEISKTDDVQGILNDQDTEINVPEVDTEPPQHHQSHIQDSNTSSAPRHQAAEQSSLAEHDPATEEKHAEAIEGFIAYILHADHNASLSGKVKEEIKIRECNGSPSQTCTDQLQVLLPLPEENGSCSKALEEQQGVEENSQSNLDKGHETSHVECSNRSVTVVKEVAKEAEGLPAKKKRRMGMCGLMGKERSYFLQTRKGENGQKKWERAEKQETTADLKAQEEIIPSPPLSSSLSFPAGIVSEQKETEAQLQSSHSERDDRSETKVHIAATTSDETSAVCDLGCWNRMEEDTVPGPDQNGDTKLDPPAEDELSGNKEQHELEARTAQSVAQQQLKAMGDESAVVDQSPAIIFDGPVQSKKTENWDAMEAAPRQVMSVTRTRDEKNDEPISDAGGVALSTDSWSGSLSCVHVQRCEAAVSPSGSVEKDSSAEPGASPSTLNAEQHLIRNTSDPFGSGCVDDLSVSQLNTISLIEEEVLEREEDLGSTECHDATDLICGLIRELSSLNRRVMATHRELETVRRSNKSLRYFTR